MHQRSLTLPIFINLITPVVLFSPIIFTGKALFWGVPSTQFIPWWSLAWENIRAGSVPLWNPYSGMGAPLMANYQSAIFYPPYWFYLLMDSVGGIAWMAWAQAIVVTAHLIWAGIGMVVFIRRLGLNENAQTIAGLAYGMSGYLVARAGFFSINACAAWLPWMMVAVTDIFEIYNRNGQDPASDGGSQYEKIIRPIKLKKYCILSFYLGMLLLAGHAQTTWYILILVSCWSIYLILSSPLRRNIPRTVLALSVAAFLGVSLAAVQLLPTAEYLLESQRASAVEYELAMSYSFWPWHFLTFLAPGLFGSPAHGDYWGFGNYWEDAVYIGMLPFILAVSGILIWVRERVRGLKSTPAAFFFIVAAVVSPLALGRNTPIFPWLYMNVPSFDMFQAPARLMLLTVFSLAVLAAYGADQWRRPSGKALYWTRLSLMGSFAIVTGSFLASWLFRIAGLDIKPSLMQATLLAGIWALGSGILSLFAPERSTEKESKNMHSPFWGWAVGIWVATDLLVAGWGLNPGISVDFYTIKNNITKFEQESFDQGRLYLSKEDEEFLKFDLFFRFDTFDPFVKRGSWADLRESLLPNLNILNRIPSVNNFDPLVPSRYAEWMSMLESSKGARKENLLKLMNVSIIEQVNKNNIDEVNFIHLAPSQRIRWVPCSIRVDNGEEALQRITTSKLDFDTVVILEGSGAQIKEGCTEVNGINLIELRDEPRYLKIEIKAEHDGYLFIADTWYPGWRALVDGDKVDILRANYLFKAIYVPSGRHVVEMVYKPGVFYLGASISVMAWVVLILGMLYTIRHGNIQP